MSRWVGDPEEKAAGIVGPDFLTQEVMEKELSEQEIKGLITHACWNNGWVEGKLSILFEPAKPHKRGQHFLFGDVHEITIFGKRTPDTALHEAAHMLTNNGHGKDWAAMFNFLLGDYAEELMEIKPLRVTLQGIMEVS